MKTCSIKKYMYLGSALVSAIILIGCLTFGIYTIHQYKGSYQKEHELQTKSNIQRLNKDIASMQSYLNNVFTDVSDIAKARYNSGTVDVSSVSSEQSITCRSRYT